MPMTDERCQRCCANCRFAMPVEHQGEPLLVCPYRQERRGRLAVVEPEEGCPAFRERVRPKEESGEETCAIPLVNMDGLCALVDAADYEWLSRYTWRAASSGGGTFYAHTRCNGKVCYMHRMIMNPPAGMVVDHKNRDGLDNHRVNLRNATPGQNNANRQLRTGVSGFRGVYPSRDKWGARIRHQRRLLRLGVFDDPAEAARAYDHKAIELHGEFACLNFPEEAGRRTVYLGGTARVCRAVAARVRRMRYGSSLGPLAPLACVDAIPPLRGQERACPCHAEQAGERHSGLPASPAARLFHAGRPAFTGHYFSLGPSARRPCRCHAQKAGGRAPGSPVASRWVPLWARGPPLWALLLQFHGPVGVVEELLPGAVSLVAQVEVEHGAVLGLDGLLNQEHARLLGSPAAFPGVAARAGAYDVLPGRLAAQASGDHVVQREFRHREAFAAVLAVILVPGEDVAAVEFHVAAGQAIVEKEANDPRHRDVKVHRGNPVVGVGLELVAGLADLDPALEIVVRVGVLLDGNHLGQIAAQKGKRPPNADNTDGHVVLVEH